MDTQDKAKYSFVVKLLPLQGTISTYFWHIYMYENLGNGNKKLIKKVTLFPWRYTKANEQLPTSSNSDDKISLRIARLRMIRKAVQLYEVELPIDLVEFVYTKVYDKRVEVSQSTDKDLPCTFKKTANANKV